MSRVYLNSKKISVNPDLYSRYDILNLYCENEALRRGSENVVLYGLFLSDISAIGGRFHGNEVHFSILFSEREKAEALFEKLNSHLDIKRFQESLDFLIGKEINDVLR
jgi:hypothetical protein